MIVLGIDSTGDPLSVAASDGARVELREAGGPRDHAAVIIALVDGALAALSARRAEMIAVNVGPGSYTGTRVGVATAQGLARGWGASMVGVGNFEALAERSARVGTIAAAIDARRGEIAAALVARTEGEVEVIDGPWCEDVASIAARISDAHALAGDGARLLAQYVSALEAAVLSPAAPAVIKLGLRRFERCGGQRPEDVLPRYPRAGAREFRKTHGR